MGLITFDGLYRNEQVIFGVYRVNQSGKKTVHYLKNTTVKKKEKYYCSNKERIANWFVFSKRTRKAFSP